MSKNQYDEYFYAKEVAYAIEIGNPVLFKTMMNPKAYIEIFLPPQSFRYFDISIFSNKLLTSSKQGRIS